MKKVIVFSIMLLSIGIITQAQSSDDNRFKLKADINQDGFVDRDEFESKLSEKATKRKKIGLKAFDRLDTNNDNLLDRKELMHTRANGKRGKGRSLRGRKQLKKKQQLVRAKKRMIRAKFNHLDRNGNGVLHFREFKKGAKKRPNYSRSRAKIMFNRLDGNNDGLISKREFGRISQMQKGRNVRRR